MGFAQILNGPLSDDEKKSIAKTMKDSSTLLNRLIAMLFDSSDYGRSKEEISNKHEKVNCNDVAHEAIHDIHVYHPEVRIKFNSSVSDDFCIYTNRLNLMRSLRELLYNAIRYSDGENIMIAVELGPKKTDGPKTIRFVVQDTGKGIAESDRELIFNFFTKIDDLSEGLGLGLPLSKRHAQNLGGDLTLDTSYQDGCRFIITLPIE
jgi:signal transduction histidine kinase